MTRLRYDTDSGLEKVLPTSRAYEIRAIIQLHSARVQFSVLRC